MAEKSGSNRGSAKRTGSPIEDALRWLATNKQFRPLDLLRHAIKDAGSDASTVLEPLITPTSSLPQGDPESRALAAWGLIVDEIDEVGPSNNSRRRNALMAAFRLPRRPEIVEPWKATLGDRFGQLLTLREVFGNPPPGTTTPMHKAWRFGLTDKLVPALRTRLVALAANGTDWLRYVEVASKTEVAIARDQASPVESPDPTAGYRPPSRGAQPVFLDLFRTTVFMKRRAVYRRIIERLITAQEDHVDSYMARALLGSTNDSTNTPVRGLWGCSATVVTSPPGEPVLTRLRFPRSLSRGDKHYFCSEATDENITTERLWVNIEVDHHGIAPGRRMYDLVPISGLTIRIVFDDDYLPDACWWYAEQTERERRQRPADGDPRLLTVVGNTVEHTFPEKCHPRENYGISFLWPML